MPSSDRVVECFKEPIKEVENTGELLGFPRLEGETEATFRTRIAYEMQLRLNEMEAKPIPEKVVLRSVYWFQKAIFESKGFPMTLSQEDARVLDL